MVIHKCDVCKQIMQRWYEVTTRIDAEESWINVSDMLPYKARTDICPTCYDTIRKIAITNCVDVSEEK